MRCPWQTTEDTYKYRDMSRSDGYGIMKEIVFGECVKIYCPFYLIYYSTGVLVGFAAGLTFKVNLKLTRELKNNIETMESFGIPVKAVETYFVRSKDDPNKFFKVIKF